MFFAQYPPRSSNAIKSQSNWERKSQYLLTEIVKYDSYIDSLQAAMSLRLKRRGEKALERALVVSSPEDDPTHIKWKGYPDEETIPEGDEPPVTPSAGPQLGTHFHRRGSADTRQR
jgi:PH/SEC7 domain-containing protein